MTIKEFVFYLQKNLVDPEIFFNNVPDVAMIPLKNRIDKASTEEDAIEIMNLYV